MTVAVLVPVLARPHRVEPLLESLYGSVNADEVRPVFIANPRDEEEIAAVAATGTDMVVVEWDPGSGDYWKKINLGLRRMRDDGHEWCFQAADDLRFHPGWLEQCLAMHERTNACVIGTNDLGNQRVQIGVHSTHSLVRTEYLECGLIDEPNADAVFFEGYGHWFGDDEFIQCAIWRETFAACPHAIVEHLHPEWEKAEWDSTYTKGRSTEADDQALYVSRRHLWGKGWPVSLA